MEGDHEVGGASEDELTVKRDKLAQVLGTGLRAYFMSQFIPGAKASIVDYECTTEGKTSVVRFRIDGVKSKLFKAVRLELHLEHPL